jgi:hypothetical protein
MYYYQMKSIWDRQISEETGREVRVTFMRGTGILPEGG